MYRLRFNGISYRADIWLNGKKIASADTIEGSFRQFVFDITTFLKKGENVLSLKFTRPKEEELNIGFVDWNSEPAGNNMGIWRDVELLSSGLVVIEQLFIITDVDRGTHDHADITLKIKLHNYSDKEINGILNANVEKDIRISKMVKLEAGETKEVKLDSKNYPILKIDHPRLWWTHDLGKPNFYSLEINNVTQNQTFDVKNMRWGIRSITG